MGGFSIWHWLIVLLVVVLLFGTKKLRNAGSDLGSAIRSFRKGLADDEPARIEPGRDEEPGAARAGTERSDAKSGRAE